MSLPATQPAEPVYLTARGVLRRYDRRNLVWLWRRLKDGSGFPQPAMQVAGQNYWAVNDLEAFEEQCAEQTRKARGAAAEAR